MAWPVPRVNGSVCIKWCACLFGTMMHTKDSKAEVFEAYRGLWFGSSACACSESVTSVGRFASKVVFHCAISTLRLHVDEGDKLLKRLSASNNIATSAVNEVPVVGMGDSEGWGVGVEVGVVGPRGGASDCVHSSVSTTVL